MNDKGLLEEEILEDEIVEQSFLYALGRIYLPALICFLIVNILTSTILHLLEQHHLLYVSDANLRANEERTNRFFLDPIKSVLFLVCTGVLGFQLVKPVTRIWQRIGARDAIQTVWAFCIGLALTFTLTPTSFGRSYARISTDPFNQVPDQIYRRLLIPGLAYLYHLNGFLYIVLCWGILFVTVLVAKTFLKSRGQSITLLEEASLLTVGIFVSSFQMPGYPESAVLLLALIALMDFEATGRYGVVQIAAFGLALLAHESCAVIVFAPMALFLWGRRSWLPFGGLVLAYGFALLANFGFDPSYPLHEQSHVAEIPAAFYFRHYPLLVLAGVFFAFKLLWAVVPTGAYFLWREQRRMAFFVCAGIVLAIAATYIAVDYTRMVSFATLAVLVCYAEARAHLSPRLWKVIMVLNLVVPSIYVGGNSGSMTLRGIYDLVFRGILRLPLERFH